MKPSKFIFTFFLVALITFSIALFIERSVVIDHEQVHQKICTYMGYEATTKYDGLTGSTTACINATIEDLQIMYPLDVQNEIITYNLKSLRLVGYALLFFIILGKIK